METKGATAFFLCLWSLVGAQILLNSERDENIMIWCTVNAEEQTKCEAFAAAVRSTVLFDEFGQRLDAFQLNCTQTYSKDECMVLLDNNAADLTTLDPGEVFIGGRYHSLVPIMEEQYRAEGIGTESRLYGVAVIRRLADIRALTDIRGRRACFGGVGTLAGWVVPIDKLMKGGGMPIVDCNNHVKNALDYFGPSCAVNSLSDKYNPLGDNSHKLCEICGSDLPGVRCTSNDPYAGYEGALQCLMDRGEIAFLKHSAIKEYFSKFSSYQPPSGVLDNSSPRFQSSTDLPFSFGNRPQTTSTQRNFGSPFDRNQPDFLQNNSNYPFNSFDNNERPYSSPVGENYPLRGSRTFTDFKERYELLCLDGTRRDIDDWRSCNWGELPAHALVTSSAKRYRLRLRYQRFILSLVRQFGDADRVTDNQNFNSNNNFRPFSSYGNRSNLLFQDSTVSLRSIPEQNQTYTKYLDHNMNAILDIRSCPVGRMTLCVTSEAEMTKCVKMRTALNAQLLKPEMSCFKAYSHIHCMQAIRQGDVDTAIFDAGDVYTAGIHYDLIPIMSEIYNTKNTKLGEPEYFAVAVAYQGDADTELTYLKGKYSCHSGIGHGAGWIIPMAYLLSSGRMRNYGCDSVTAASQYFSKSCIPGALNKEHSFGSQHSNLCDLCRGSSLSYCSRDASEDFYGYTGAFRCLVEGGGQVAFVKHTTVSEVTDGKRRETWARNTLSGDYELLCRDGTRAPVTAYERCNLGKVKANAIVVRGGEVYNETRTQAIINLFLYAQQFYGRKDEDDFSFAMFYSPPPFSDLIFQDAAQQLQVIPREQRNFRDYLGKTFLKARALVDCRAAVGLVTARLSVVLASLLLLVAKTAFFVS